VEQGASRQSGAGRPLLLEGGLDWKAMGYSPQDMDFIEAKNGAARDIALAFGVPPCCSVFRAIIPMPIMRRKTAPSTG